MRLEDLPEMALVVEHGLEKDENGRWRIAVKLYDPRTEDPIRYYEARFIELRTPDGHAYVFAGADKDESTGNYKTLLTHWDVKEAMNAFLFDSEIIPQVFGGGHLTISHGCLTLDSSSDKFGKFDKERVEPVVRKYVQENMPYIKDVRVE